MPHRDIDRGWAWLILLASYFNLLACSGLAYVAGMFQLVFLEQFQGSVSFTSWVTALFSSLMQLAGPLSSLISNFYNCRMSVMLGGAFMSIGLFLSSFTNSLEMLFVTFGVIAGVGLGLTYTASIIIINYFFVEKRTLVNGIAFSASGLGLIITPQISQALFDNFSWRESMVILSCAAAQICIMGALMITILERKEKKGVLSHLCPCISSDVPTNYQSNEECLNDDNDHEKMDDGDIDIHCDDEEKEGMLRVNPNRSSLSERHVSNTDLKSMSITYEHEISIASPNDLSSEKSVVPSVCKHKNSLGASTGGCHHSKIDRSESLSSSQTDRQKAGSIPHCQVGSLPSATNPLTFGSLKDVINAKAVDTISSSHQELALRSKPFTRIDALKNSSNYHSQSHRELFHDSSNGHYHYTSSNPAMISRRGMKGSKSGSIKSSQMSLNPTACHTTDSQHQVVVISRNPSLMGLVPSTSPLDFFITNANDLQSMTSLHSNSMLESTVVLKNKSSVLADRSVQAGSLQKIPLEEEDIANIHNENIIPSKSMQYPPLYHNSQFWLLCLSLFVSNCGCGIFNIHVPSFIKEQGMTDSETTKILSINGFALLVGRCLVASLANSVKGIDLLVFFALHVLGGLCVCLMPPMGHSFLSMLLLVFFVGFYYGSTYAVLSPITIEIVGISSLATAFGIEMVCAGLGYFVSPPLAGILVDLTNNYSYSMTCGGIFFILGGIIVLFIPVLRWRHQLNHMEIDDFMFEEHSYGNQDDKFNSNSCSIEGCHEQKM